MNLSRIVVIDTFSFAKCSQDSRRSAKYRIISSMKWFYSLSSSRMKSLFSHSNNVFLIVLISPTLFYLSSL